MTQLKNKLETLYLCRVIIRNYFYTNVLYKTVSWQDWKSLSTSSHLFVLFDFDPVIQFGWIYNKTNSKTNQVFKSEWFGFKISIHHLLAGGPLNTFISYFFVFQFLICRLWMNFTGLMWKLNELIHWKYIFNSTFHMQAQ